MSINTITVNSLCQLEHLDAATCASLDTTSIYLNFDSDISGIDWSRYAMLYELKLGDLFNRDISQLHKVSSLHALYLGYSFNQDISHVCFPESLHTLHMGSRFDKSLDNVNFPEKMHTLLLSHHFSYSINAVKWPVHLHTLLLNWRTPTDNVEWPLNLHTLRINCGYIYHIYLPKTLHILDLSKYRYRYSDLEWMHNTSLHTLILQHDFNYVLPILHMQSLQVIIFGDEFNQNVSNIYVHEFLNTVIFGNKFNQSISLVKWPSKLEIIKFGQHFNQDITSILECCHQLMEITLGKSYVQNIAMYNWPNSLLIIHDYSCKITQTSSNFPKSLLKIIHYKLVGFSTYETNIVYERRIGSRTKAAITF
jgi:hypothetical protein